MTERLAEASRRIENVHQLEAVVTAMRGISASRVQQARDLMHGVRSYTETISSAIADALLLVPADRESVPSAPIQRGIVLFCAEQGFAGAFSEPMLLAARDAPSPHDVFLVGARGVMLAREHGVAPYWQAAMVPQANLMPVLARRIAGALYDWVSDKPAPRVDLIVPVWSTSSGVAAVARSLLPFDFRRFAASRAGQPPLTTLPPTVLLGRLADEYIFAELCEAALGAFIAENEARIAAMQSARTNLHDMLLDLQTLERQIRQDEITAEVVELASSSSARWQPGR